MIIGLTAARLTLFIAAALALIVTPGPVVIYVVTRSINQGRQAGLVSVLGLELGNLVHVLAAALGLSALLLSSAAAFNLVKYLGAAYLIFLGIQKLRTKAAAAEQVPRQDSLRRIFFQGIVVAILNPKTALFFFAFLPQFVNPTQGSVPLQVLALGAIMVTMATVSDTLYALMADSAGHLLRGSRRFLNLQRYVTGSVYIGLGLTAALSGNSRK
jgi:threonine/homoserine/homoserine lactone efflux protein